jgi:hypothetical protein
MSDAKNNTAEIVERSLLAVSKFKGPIPSVDGYDFDYLAYSNNELPSADFYNLIEELHALALAGTPINAVYIQLTSYILEKEGRDNAFSFIKGALKNFSNKDENAIPILIIYVKLLKKVPSNALTVPKILLPLIDNDQFCLSSRSIALFTLIYTMLEMGNTDAIINIAGNRLSLLEHFPGNVYTKTLTYLVCGNGRQAFKPSGKIDNRLSILDAHFNDIDTIHDMVSDLIGDIPTSTITDDLTMLRLFSMAYIDTPDPIFSLLSLCSYQKGIRLEPVLLNSFFNIIKIYPEPLLIEKCLLAHWYSSHPIPDVFWEILFQYTVTFPNFLLEEPWLPRLSASNLKGRFKAHAVSIRKKILKTSNPDVLDQLLSFSHPFIFLSNDTQEKSIVSAFKKVMTGTRIELILASHYQLDDNWGKAKHSIELYAENHTLSLAGTELYIEILRCCGEDNKAHILEGNMYTDLGIGLKNQPIAIAPDRPLVVIPKYKDCLTPNTSRLTNLELLFLIAIVEFYHNEDADIFTPLSESITPILPSYPLTVLAIEGLVKKNCLASTTDLSSIDMSLDGVSSHLVNTGFSMNVVKETFNESLITELKHRINSSGSEIQEFANYLAALDVHCYFTELLNHYHIDIDDSITHHSFMHAVNNTSIHIAHKLCFISLDKVLQDSKQNYKPITSILVKKCFDNYLAKSAGGWDIVDGNRYGYNAPESYVVRKLNMHSLLVK